jgi:hypothetical protein
MATQARYGRVCASERETGPAVVEYSARPLACAVAGLAIRREPSCCVIGIGSLVVLCQVAADTSSIQTCVSSIDVASHSSR